jgi:hypothetical protein
VLRLEKDENFAKGEERSVDFMMEITMLDAIVGI